MRECYRYHDCRAISLPSRLAGVRSPISPKKKSPTVINTTRTGLGPPTIKDVARVAMVSPMTVSRALNGSPVVQSGTRTRVLRAAELLGYRRNENARSLRPGQGTGLIGVAITNIANPYYADFVLGVEDIASGRGYRLLLATTGEDPAREKQVVSDFIGRQVEGLLVVPSGQGAEHLQAPLLRSTPVVLASRAIEGLAADTVLIDDVGGASEGTRYLLDLGHTSIGYLGTGNVTFTGRRRFEGFARALAKRGLPVDQELVRDDQRDVESAQLAALNLLEKSAPTALFCSNNRNTIGALRALRQLGVEVIDIVGFDDFELSDMTPYPVAIVEHNARELGRQAAHILFRRLDGEKSHEPAQITVLPTQLRLPADLGAGK